MAKFILYNRNPDGYKESDCVTRALSLASGLPYTEIRKKLFYTAKLYKCEKLCKFCYSNFISNILKYKKVNCNGLTVEEFADLNPNGIFLVRVPFHLTTIIDGCIYDIWDCRDEFCDTVWKRVD